MAAPASFVRWEEVFGSNDKGRKELKYYLKRRDGSSDLAVVGKEKSLRQFSYHLPEKSFLSPIWKLRSRREVVDWLNSIVTGMHNSPLNNWIGVSSKATGACNLENFEGDQSGKLGHCDAEFSWTGSPWTCRRKRKHYHSYRRNGVVISVHDFVYVLAEEDKRLVAYLDDMYEDSKGNKMVVVQWFHKVDEVGITLPHNYNNGEVFFSLCLQHLSIECIDGLAAVLSPQHFEIFMNETSYTKYEPFVCHRQFDNDDVKPFDITQVKGYWKQEILGYMSTLSCLKSCSKLQPSSDGVKPVRIHTDDAVGNRPRKRLRRSRDIDLNVGSTAKNDTYMSPNVPVPGNTSLGLKGGVGILTVDEAYPTKDPLLQKHLQNFTRGSLIEVLSQDSGVRGCWFRALIIKKHIDRVKVQYRDIKDAADESVNLEEWILASRVAAPDQLGIRLFGRTSVRPAVLSSTGSASEISVGSIVDAWWHDGWWEGIVVQKDSDERIHVYFPEEKRESIFRCNDLRHSEEWLGDGWKQLKGRQEVVRSILPGLKLKSAISISCDVRSDQARLNENNELVVHNDISVRKLGGEDTLEDLEVVHNLSKDNILAQLKWNWSRKRRLGRNFSRKLNCSVNKKKSGLKLLNTRTCDSLFIQSALKVEHDNCKFSRDSSLFASPVVPPLPNLVMSR